VDTNIKPTLKLEAAYSSEMLVSTYQTTWYDPEEEAPCSSEISVSI
jgi:hypothetical protein